MDDDARTAVAIAFIAFLACVGLACVVVIVFIIRGGLSGRKLPKAIDDEEEVQKEVELELEPRANDLTISSATSVF